MTRATAGHVGHLLAGCVGIAVGAGIGIPYATRVGIGRTAVAAFVCLAAGLVVAVSGTVGLVRRLPGRRRLLALPAGAALLMGGVLPVTFAVVVTNTPGTPLEATRPSDRGLAYSDVAFATADGVELSGWYIPSANRAAVVLMHGSGSTRSRVLDHAAVIAGHGYGVLLYDSRGNGESAGRAMALGWHGDADTAAAVEFLSRRPDVEPSRIGAVGMSMGGEQAIGAAAADPRVRAVVAEGATGRVRGDNSWVRDDVAGWLSRGFDLVAYTAIDLLTTAQQPATLRSAAAAAAPRPVLLIAAAGELEAGRHIRDGSPGTVQLWELPATGHTQGLMKHSLDWEQRVLAFLDDALLRPA